MTEFNQGALRGFGFQVVSNLLDRQAGIPAFTKVTAQESTHLEFQSSGCGGIADSHILSVQTIRQCKSVQCSEPKILIANIPYLTKGSELMKLCGSDIIISGRLLRIAHIDGDKYNFPEDPETLIDSLRKCGERIDLFTFLQKLPEPIPKYAYPVEMDNLAVLPVSTFDNWWNHQIKSFPRNRARQAEKKGVVLREVACDEALIQGICGIYNESRIRQGRRFPHYGMTFDMARDYARTFPDRSIFVGAFVGDTLIGFIKLVMDESRTHACLVHILSMIQHRDKAPTNALLAQAVKICADRGISYLVYENFTYGKKQGDSLSHFKEVNGFQRMDLPRYYIPLTPLGRIAFRLGLHHRLTDRLPESLVAKLRELRTAWYERRFQLKAQSL